MLGEDNPDETPASIVRYVGQTMVPASARGATLYGYDKEGRNTVLTHRQQATLDAPVLGQFGTAFDTDSGALLTDSKKWIVGPEYTRTFEYDGSGRLKNVDTTGEPPVVAQYDGNGNRAGSGRVINSGNRLTEDRSYVYKYDKEGHLVKRFAKQQPHADDAPYANITYTWDHRGRLTSQQVRQLTGSPPSAENNDITTIQYYYDGLNRLVGRFTTVEDVRPDAANPSTVTTTTWTGYGYSGNTEILEVGVRHARTEFPNHPEQNTADSVPAGTDQQEIVQLRLVGAGRQVLAVDDTRSTGSSPTVWMFPESSGTVSMYLYVEPNGTRQYLRRDCTADGRSAIYGSVPHPALLTAPIVWTGLTYEQDGCSTA